MDYAASSSALIFIFFSLPVLSLLGNGALRSTGRGVVLSTYVQEGPDAPNPRYPSPPEQQTI